jgi:VWFA-related protein
LLLTASSLVTAQQSKTFRTEINYVELHVSVTAKDGQRVRGLTKADFVVKESGAAQVIDSVEEISLPVPAPRDVRVPEPDGTVADAGAIADGRVYAIVIDRSHLDQSMTPKLGRQLSEFIDDFVTPADLVAVVNLGGSGATPFTSNKARLRAALGIGNLVRGAVSSDAGDLAPAAGGGRFESEAAQSAADIAAGFAAAEAARDTTTTVLGFDAMADLATFLRGFEGRRKALIYVSAGIDIAPGQASSGGGGTDPEQKVNQNAIASAYNRMIKALVANNITVYSIDPKGLSTFDPFDGGGSQRALSLTPGTKYAGGVEMMRGIADDTGGIAVVGFNDLTKPYQRIVEDSSQYYVIGYMSNRPADGKRHSIAVEVQREGVEVRARREIEAASSKSKPDAGLSVWRKTDVVSLLARPVPTADPGLRLRLTASPVAWRGEKAIVQVAAEIHQGGLSLISSPAGFADDVVAGIQVVNEKGGVEIAKSETVKLRVRPETRDAIRDRGWRYVTEIELSRGVYQLRVAASESNDGKSGSAFLDLAIPDMRKEPLSVAGLALASDSARLTPTAGSVPTLRALGPLVVTGSRAFSSSEKVTAIAAVVDTISGDHTAAISAALVGADGSVAKQTSETVESKTLRPEAPPRALALTLDGVPAGDYLLVVKVEAAGKSAKRTLVVRLVK